jgi:hypothetical protein
MTYMKSNQLPIYCSSSFKWKNNQGTVNKSDLIVIDTKHMVGEYDGVLIESSKTGNIKYFEPVQDEDGYDGEFMIYKNDDIFITIWNY